MRKRWWAALAAVGLLGVVIVPAQALVPTFSNTLLLSTWSPPAG